MVANQNVIKFKKDPYIVAEIGINHNGYLRLAKNDPSFRNLGRMLLNFKKKR